MNYELAKKLKAGGFPQTMRIGDPFYENGELRFDDQYESESSVYKIDDHPNLSDSYAKAPTLSELIEACGKNFLELKNKGSTVDRKTFWKANGVNVSWCEGWTPESAVANLWLALNKK